MAMRRVTARSGEWAQHFSNASCFDFCCFRAMTQQSILHLVVNWEVFTTNICCLLVTILFRISIFTFLGY